jgi:hypothetical protein
MVLVTEPPHPQRQQQLAGGQVVADTLQELPFDLPRRYQAELRPSVEVPVVPGVSGLEIWPGMERETKWQGPSVTADIVTFHYNQQVCGYGQVVQLSTWSDLTADPV